MQINVLSDKSLIEKINSFILETLEETKNMDPIWYFRLKREYFKKEQLIPFPVQGRNHFTDFTNEELEKKIEVLKKYGGKGFYATSLQSLMLGTGRSGYYYIPYSLHALKEVGSRSDDFRYNGWCFFVSDCFNFFFLLEWDMDIIVGRVDFLKDFFQETLASEREEFGRVFATPITQGELLLLDCFELSKSV